MNKLASSYLCLCLFTLLFSFSSYAALPSEVDAKPLPTLAPMLKNVIPAVVNISTKTQVQIRENNFFDDPFFDFFFKDFSTHSRKREESSLGSGVIVDASKGYVITNNHVIDNAHEISVTLKDGRKVEAHLIGADTETDIALIQIPADNLTALHLADSDQLQVGDFVVAIGNPFGLGQTVTSGIVSALERSGLGIEGYENFIQTDASINPGNSGGALVNLHGELVGINTAILARGGGNIGIGFAIPTNMVAKVVEHLITHGEVKRGFLGVQAQDLTTDLAAAFNLQAIQGALVIDVEKESAADKAGLQASDVIIAIDGKTVNNADGLRTHIGLLAVGDKVGIDFMRQGRLHQVIAIITTAHDSINGNQITPHLNGTKLSDNTNQIMIVDVERGSSAWQAGLRPNDVITHLNRRPIKQLKDLMVRIQRYSPPYLIHIQRGNSTLSFLFQ